MPEPEAYKNKIICGNSLEVLKNFPSESIDMCMFSPPYYGLRDYGRNAETVWSDGWLGQLGLEPNTKMYVQHMVEINHEIKRILKQTGSMYIVLGDTYAGSNCGRGDKTLFQNYRRMKVAENLYDKPSPQAKTKEYKPKCLIGVPWRVAFALIDDGWILRNCLVWFKPNHMPSSVKDRYSNTYEFIFFFVKNRKYYFNLDAIREPHTSIKDLGRKRTDQIHSKYYGIRPSGYLVQHPKGKNPGDCWSIPTKPFKETHFAVMPEDICVKPILSSCPENGIVLDPFCGSGTTCVVAKKLSRNYIGIDINQRYCEIARQRLAQVPEKLTNFMEAKIVNG
ncbi:MAG: site-specific DNA-methyltransferase [Nitrososphaeria archaeon]